MYFMGWETIPSTCYILFHEKVEFLEFTVNLIASVDLTLDDKFGLPV